MTSDVWLKCVLLLLPVFFIGNATAQNSCSNPDTLVTGGYYTINLPVGTGSAPSGPDYGCLTSQNSPTWFFMNICEPGDIEFQITSGGSGTDIDFICWGPINSVSSLSDMCSQVSAQTVSIEDWSFSQSYIETINITRAAAGEFYLVMITNFTDLAGTINIQQIGGTGITCDSIVANSAFCST